MKNFINRLSVLFLVFFTTIFISCEKDLYEDSIKNNSRKLNIKKVSLSDIDNNTSFKIVEKVKQFKNQVKQSKSNQNNQADKFAYNEVFDLYIDYDNGKVIEDGNNLFYTFPMFRKSEDNLENILFIPKENGQVDLYFVKYNVKPEDLKYLTESQKNNLSVQFYRQTGELVCFDVINRFLVYPNGCQETHSNGYTCTLEVVTEISTFCSWVSGGGGSNSSGGNIGGGNIGGGGNTGNPTITEPIPQIITSIVGLTPAQINFKDFVNNLSNEQFEWWNNAPDEIINGYEDYFEKNTTENGINANAIVFAQQLITNSILFGLDFDINASTKSPAFVDMSSIDSSTPEGAKFNEVYNALKTSLNFKNLFVDLFQSSPFLNIKFQILEIPQTNVSIQKGNCTTHTSTNSSFPYNVITIDKNHLLNDSNLDIALTIIHEYIHAYLSVKLHSPTIGLPISNINNLDLTECLNTYYNGFSGNQTQHAFFVDYMIPVIVEILFNVKDVLVTPQEASQIENPIDGGAIIYRPLTTPPQLGQISDIQVNWSWSTFFHYFAYGGLQFSSSYPFSIPLNSNHVFNNNEDYYRFYFISAYNAIFNQ